MHVDAHQISLFILPKQLILHVYSKINVIVNLCQLFYSSYSQVYLTSIRWAYSLVGPSMGGPLSLVDIKKG